MIANDDGKLIGLPCNRPLRDSAGVIYDIFVGTFLVVGLKADDFSSLSDELIEKYTKVFSVEYAL